MTVVPQLTAEAAAVLDGAACGLAELADDGTFRRINRTFCQWLGVPAEALIGRRRLQDLLTVGGRIFHQTHWTPLLRMQGSVSEVKLEVVHADGSHVPLMLNAIRHESGGVVVHQIAAFVARDRDRYEQELLRARKRLEALVAETTQLHAEAKDRALWAEQLNGVVSHDLRNPMSTILMAAAVLAKADLPGGQQRLVNQISRATERATRLIGDLLDFTQARLGRGLDTTPVAIDLHAVVADALDDLRLAYPQRELVQVRTGDGGCTADGNRVAQLLGNLVANAAAYGSPEIPITVTSTIGDSTWSVAVHNGGPPIPAEVQAVMFEPMLRGTAARTRARGVGLGLFIVREIARAHGGTTSVHSTAGDGTTFTAVFPRTS